MTEVITVLGTRPELVKLSPLLPALDRVFRHELVHTGQHYDELLDGVFFRELELRAPDHQLSAGSASPATQIARMLVDLERVLSQRAPKLVVVQGDTNSAFAGAWVAARLGIPVAHVEAGCRSFAPSPEELNRVLIARLAARHFAPDAVAVRNLRAEGIDRRCIVEVGNTGLDACRRTARLARVNRLDSYGVTPGRYVLATIHRAENTDDPARLRRLLEALDRLTRLGPVLFPAHPRTVAAMTRLDVAATAVRLLPPLGPLDFTAMLRGARFVVSDSGGVQEEAAVLNRPCLIVRDETEWRRLVTAGKNFLVGTTPDRIVSMGQRLFAREDWYRRIRARPAPLRFGATRRVIDELRDMLDGGVEAGGPRRGRESAARA